MEQQEIKNRLSKNLNDTYIEEEKEKLWLCLKELQDMAWEYQKDGSWNIFKKIFWLLLDISDNSGDKLK